MCYGTCRYENRDGECAYKGRGPLPCEVDEDEYVLERDPDFLRDCAREMAEERRGRDG